MTSDFIGYMCKTDFDHDLRGATDGARVYPSENALRGEQPCVAECGLVRVRVVLEEIVQDPDFSGLVPERIDPG